MPGKSKTSLKMLQARLRGLQTSFDNMFSFMEDYTDDTRVTEVKVRLDRLDALWDRINENIEEVESHEESTSEPESFVKVRIDFENRFYQLKSFLLDKIRENSDETVLNPIIRSHDNTHSAPNPHVRLPQITLPKFSGKIDEWQTFRDLYTSLIHWQPDLPEIEKFHYLRSQLEGEALAVIDSLPLTRANYAVAWDLICTRYSNSKILRKRQVQALFELPDVKRESAAELHTLLDSYEKIVKSLDQATPQSTEFKDLLLLHLLSSRLDSATRRSWEEYSATKETDTVKDLTDFLQRRIQILEALPNRPVEQRMEAGSSKFPRKPNVVKVCNTTLQPSAPIKCVACSDSHLLYQCAHFLKLPVSEMDGMLRSHSVC